MPSAGQWDSLHLLAYELFVTSERDRFCYFYVCFLPEVWSGAMTMSQPVRPEALGLPAGEPVWLGSRVPGMGWTSAVAVTNMAHRTMLNYVWTPAASPPEKSLPSLSLVPVFRTTLEVRKDRPFPISGQGWAKSSWSVSRVCRKLP